MTEWINLVPQPAILAVSLAFLIKSSDIVSDSSTRIARITGLGEMAIGFLILSVVTSLPELAVSVSAVNSGDIGLPIGSLFGSNIANIGLILGLTVVLSPITVSFSRRDQESLSFMAGIAFLAPLLILLLGRFSKVVGWVLLATFIAFSVYSIRGRISLQGETEEVGSSRWAKELGMILGGIVVVIVSSQFVVNSSVEISNLLGIDQSVIGATVIAVGTSLPELSVSLAAVKKARASLALGNILGSCVTNLTLILGFVLAVSPLKVNPILFADLVIMLIIVNLALWGVVADHKIGFGGGITLLLLYIVFAVSTLGIQVVLLSPEYLTHFVTIAVNTAVQLFPYALVGSVAFALGFSLGRG